MIVRRRQQLERLHAEQRRSGLAVVEFAIVAPVLVFLVLGMVEVSRALLVRQVLSDACRSACRLAIKGGATTATVQANARTVLDANGITSGNATVTVKVNGNAATDVSSAQNGDAIQVQVTIPASRVAWVSSLFIPGSTNIIQSVVMYHQI